MAYSPSQSESYKCSTQDLAGNHVHSTQHHQTYTPPLKPQAFIMSSPQPKIMAVIGATGNQGSSVAKTFVSLPGWHVRGITRSTSSAKAKEIEQLGVEIVQADLDDQSSLLKAFDGAHAVFCNTDFWGPYGAGMKAGIDPKTVCKTSYDTEVRHGLNAFAAAAQVASIERFVYSALGPMARASNGKFVHSHHWESKAAIVDHIFGKHSDPTLTRMAGKTSLIYIGAFFSNPLLLPRLDPKTGQYICIIPGPSTTKMPIIDPASSTGPFVHKLVEVESVGTRLLAYDEYPTLKEIFDQWTDRTGTAYVYNQTTLEEIHQITGVPYEILDGVGFLCENEYCKGVDGVIEPHQLKEKVVGKSYSEYLKEQEEASLLGRK